MRFEKRKNWLWNSAIASGIILVALLFETPIFSKRNDYFGKPIHDIIFKGNKNTPDSEILYRIEMRKGKILSEALLNSDLKALFATGFFYFIDIQAETVPANGGVKLTFQLKERPRVEEIEFIGAEEIFPSELRDKMPLKENEVISPERVSAAREMVLKKYRDEGFFHAYVRADISKVNPKTNTVKVKFIIDEGDEIPVAKINILGTKNIDAAEIVGFLDLKEMGMIESGIFKETAFETDKQKVIAYLKSRGYIDAELVPDATGWEIRWENARTKNKRVIVVNFKVNEGDIYYFNGYHTSHDYTMGDNGVPIFLNREQNKAGTSKDKLKPIYETSFLENLYEFAPSDVGEIFDETKFARDRALINELYSNKGYLFAQVVPKRRYLTLSEKELAQFENCKQKKGKAEIQTCEEDAKELNIKKLRELYEKKPELRGKRFVHTDFTIRENNLAYLENIIVKGNKKTKDEVIRRELLIKPGELFNSELVNRSRERIFNLGYFKEVNFNMRPGSDESKMNLIIEVLEQPTGTISMGGGYGTISGFSIFTELGENNLNGTGQRVSGRLEFGPLRKFFQLSWTQPWIFGKPWTLTISAFYASQLLNVGAAAITENNNQAIKERATYERARVGMSAGISHRFFINWNHFHRYSPSFFLSTSPSSLVSDRVLAEVNRGWQFRSSVTNGLGYDNRDNVFNATRGFFAMLSMENVGQYLGGHSHFDNFRPLAEIYHTWFDYTFFGLIRSNTLRRWKVVQEFRTSSSFIFERNPRYHEQDRIKDPYIQVMDLNYLGGYESLRGWRFDDSLYPNEWKDGANHRILFGSELRFPIEPTLLWFVVFFDAGAMYEEVNRATGERAKGFKSWDQTVSQTKAATNPIDLYMFENWDRSGKRLNESPLQREDPGRLVLSSNNVALDRFKYSWGVGIRIQIPVLPLRLYFAQKLQYKPEDHGHYTGGPIAQQLFGTKDNDWNHRLFWNDHPFTKYGQDKNFQFVFGIGDYRF